ncbi:MAG: hypothetical protein CSA53_01990 [Gammaproteobacteria bacterium]|nr:MAG: hypothetical protein CSA53_01990 [Gammaproteobacteria bacterium]
MTDSKHKLITRLRKAALGFSQSFSQIKHALLCVVMIASASIALAEEVDNPLAEFAAQMQSAAARITAAALATSSGEESAYNDLSNATEQFANQLRQLDPELPQSMKNELNLRWRAISNAAKTIEENGPQARYLTTIALELASSLPGVQQQLKSAVSMMQAQKAPLSAIGAAQEALWLSEKIARHINSLRNATSGSNALGSALITDSSSFVRSLEALLTGDSAMGVDKLDPGQVRETIRSAASQFSPITRAASRITEAVPGVVKANKAREYLLVASAPLASAITKVSAVSESYGKEVGMPLTNALGIAGGLALLISLPALAGYFSKRRQLATNIRGIKDMQYSLARLAEGDLTVRVPEDNRATRDVAREINNVTDRQRDLVRNIQAPFGNSVQEVNKISASIKSQADKGKIWSGTMLKSTTAANDMLALSEEIKNATADAAKSLEHSRQRVERGYELTKNMSRASADVRQSLQDTSKSAKRQGELIQSVTSAVEYIQALNTKISVVAINTRIEAEKAGEHGRPFLGIAEAIADLLREAEEEGRRIISEVRMLQNMSADNLSSMENTVGTVVTILEYVDKLDTSLEEINADSTAISSTMSAAKDSAIRSADKAQNLNNSITRISDRSAEVTEMSERAHASISSLQSAMLEVSEKLRQVKLERSFERSPATAASRAGDISEAKANTEASDVKQKAASA